MERRLTAILCADVVGYSRLLELDESGTLAALRQRRRDILNPLVVQHHGRIVKVMGDGALVEFASAVNAVACAVDLQKQMAAANEGAPADRHVVLRIGINLGDVVVEGGDLYGDGVVVATRLQALAAPGDIWIAAGVHDQIETKLALTFEDLGPCELKNMVRPVHVYRLAGEPLTTPLTRLMRAATAVPVKPSIAILPFANLGGDPDQQYFSDGLTQDIITELSRFRSFLVISHYSSFTYQGRPVSPQSAGREMGVHYVVEGSVRKAGDRVRVTVQLIDAESGNHLWAEHYDRNLADIFAVQDEVTQNIVANLAGRLEDAGGERALLKGTGNLSKYDLLQQGKYLLHRGARDDVLHARELFQQVLDLDPSDAAAHVANARTYLMEVMAGWAEEPEAATKRVYDIANRAIELDDRDSQAHLLLAWAYFHGRSNFDLAASRVDTAITLNPNDCDNYCFKGWLLTCSGDLDGGITCAHEALRRNPLVPDTCLYTIGTAEYLAGRYERALAIFGKINPHRYLDACAWMAACYAQLGRSEDARLQAQEFLDRARTELEPNPARDLQSWRSYWTQHMQFKDASLLDGLLDSFREAGLPN